MKLEITLLSIAGGLILMTAIFAILAAMKKPSYRRRGQLLLLNEQRFLTALLQALPNDTILTFKVRLLDIVSVTDARSGKVMESDLRDYCVDFVLIDRDTTDVRLCIEMDMEGGSAGDRLARNTYISRALRRANIPHLRLPLVRYYDPHRLRQIIHEAINPPRSAIARSDQEVTAPARQAPRLARA
ncbi:MAG: DUF2726 domain-containing protein [Rhodospirillales bacterium]|nr:DUF2726 domain-containing protein [Alphaproteobacteria bacterium]MCB9986704.1 DUF2726 domain-containing protein [Rhodospirillales bacterium]USO06771.1 MAG: DUF2726 domain-containing protein [Rhodospirillales bacterium]